MQPVILALTIVLGLLLVIAARRYTQGRERQLENVLSGMAGKWVRIQVGGSGGWELFITVTGTVTSVARGRLFLDSPSTEVPEPLARMAAPHVDVDNGIQLEEIKAVYGPREARLWP